MCPSTHTYDDATITAATTTTTTTTTRHKTQQTMGLPTKQSLVDPCCPGVSRHADPVALQACAGPSIGEQTLPICTYVDLAKQAGIRKLNNVRAWCMYIQIHGMRRMRSNAWEKQTHKA